MSHIELARWADLILIAPATANFLGALAGGMAQDLLQTLCLASNRPIVVAPAMNHVMWLHPAVQANCELLRSRGVRLLGPGVGEQACGESGPGRMLEPAEIVDAMAAGGRAREFGLLAGIKTVITAGPTREPLDPVRYVTNRSSGKMGYAVAAAAREQGADVVLVSGPVSQPTPLGVRRIDVETAEQMYAAVHAEIADTAIFIACAAVSDYRPASVAPTKIKRSEERLTMDLVRSPDTLASVAAGPAPPFTVGFAAETNDVEQHARAKLTSKGVDMIAANKVGPACGFDAETNQLAVFWEGGRADFAECAKTVLAQQLIKLIAERYRATTAASTSAAHS